MQPSSLPAGHQNAQDASKTVNYHCPQPAIIKVTRIEMPEDLEDPEFVEAALRCIFEVEKTTWVDNLHTGFDVNLSDRGVNGRPKLSRIQEAYSPVLHLQEKYGRPVQRVLTDWARYGIKVDLLFFEPDPMKSFVVAAWHYTDVFPTTTGVYVVEGQAPGDTIEYRIELRGTLSKDSNADCALAQRFLSEDTKTQMGTQS